MTETVNSGPDPDEPDETELSDKPASEEQLPEEGEQVTNDLLDTDPPRFIDTDIAAKDDTIDDDESDTDATTT